MKKKSAQLFDGTEQDADLDNVRLTVNDDFARKLQHNKQREELHRLQERHPEVTVKAALHSTRPQLPETEGNSEVESSEEEDEDDGYIPNTVEKQIFETLAKIRQRDSSIYDSKKHFFKEPADSNSHGGTASASLIKKASKPMRLKDVIAQQALEHGVDEADSDVEEQESSAEPTYVQEQQDLKRSFLQAVEEQGEENKDNEFGGGVLRKRQRTTAQKQQSGGEDLQQSLDAYFGTEAPLNDDDNFLRQYVLNKGWVEAEEADVPTYQDIVGAHDAEDEAYDEQADQFEAAYNFRFEEEGGRQMVTHPRVMENTVRKTDDRRKRKRAEKAERKAAEESTQVQEVKRLKNLKGQEIQDRLQRIKDIAGPSGQDDAALDALMKGDFDPDQYDQQMAAAFGDDYYEGEEEGSGDILDEELQQQLNEMADYTSGDEEHPAAAEDLSVAGTEDEPDEEDGDAAGAAAALALQRQAVTKLLAEYDKLDYEDNIGGLKTRFKYRSVPKEDYGLSTDEILRLKDKELNQLVGLKRMAPYRDDRGKFRPNYGMMKELQIGQQQKQAQWQQRQQERQTRKIQAKHKVKQQGATASGAANVPATNGAGLDAKAQRMKSFQPLSMNKSKHNMSQQTSIQKTKKKQKAAPSTASDNAHAGLSKAARKNMKRSAKRAAIRTQNS